jgi:hypothetical protein
MYEHMDKSKVAKKVELKKYQHTFFQTIEKFENRPVSRQSNG